jgi:hypothetical protein
MKKVEEIRQTQKKYCSRAMVLAIFVGIAFILAGYKPVGKGLVLGTVFSIVNFILMGETLPMRFGKPKGRTLFVSLGSIAGRYFLLAIPIVTSIKYEQFSFFATTAGIFMVQIVLLADHLQGLVKLPHFIRKTVKGRN